jgi:hypothetical protein
MYARLATCVPIALGLVSGPALVAAHTPHARAGPASCDKMSWSVERERRWFAAKGLSHRASGARLKTIDRAVRLSLEPRKQVELFLPPEIRPKPHTYSGEVTFFGVPALGQYQVTLSDPAAIDVFENGARLRATGFTSEKSCPGVYESMRFELAPGDLVLVQITNAVKKSIQVAFARAESDTAW